MQATAAAGKLGSSAASAIHAEQRQKKAALWQKEPHYCECCGKLMLQKFGSGRFCSRTCANTKKHSSETRAKIQASMKAYVAEHPLSSEQLAELDIRLEKARSQIKAKQALKLPIYSTCCWCGTKIDISTKKPNKLNRHYCSGICRNMHLNQLRVIGSKNNVSKWEADFQSLLKDNDITFEANKRDLLPNGLEVDLWLPAYNTAIELNGIWHYSVKPYGTNIDKFNARIQKDLYKKEVAEKLGINLIVIEDRNIPNNDYMTVFINIINSLKGSSLIG